MTTISDVKNWLGDFHKRNPQIVTTMFADSWSTKEEINELKEFAADPNNWYQLVPGDLGDYPQGEYDDMDEYMTFADGCIPNHHCETSTYLPANKVSKVYTFGCEPFDGQFEFLVLELPNGGFVLGDYIGD